MRVCWRCLGRGDGVISGMITGRWREARQLPLWLAAVVRVLHLLPSKLL